MDSLIIVFVKTPKLGAVKSRLAYTIGDEAALTIYIEFLKILENTLLECKEDIVVYFSETIDSDFFKNYPNKIQYGEDLGQRMYNAFEDGFSQGYRKIILIGSDIPDMKSTNIRSAFEQLDNNKVVFGPALDGGYYLIGLSELLEAPFKLKQWSNQFVLKNSLKQLQEHNIHPALIAKLNDIDTFEDLLNSETLKTNTTIRSVLNNYYDKRN